MRFTVIIVRRVKYMAASPIATSNGDEQAPVHHQPNHKWTASQMEVEPARDHMGPGGDIDTNGASHPVDDRSAPGQEPAEYPAPASVADSAGDAAARAEALQRGEKLIKVLFRSLVCAPFAVSSPLSPLSSLSVALQACPSPRSPACLPPSAELRHHVPAAHTHTLSLTVHPWPELAMSLFGIRDAEDTVTWQPPFANVLGCAASQACARSVSLLLQCGALTPQGLFTY